MSNLNEINKTHNPLQRGCGEYWNREAKGKDCAQPIANPIPREKKKKKKKSN
jgi:hypothetical protein